MRMQGVRMSPFSRPRPGRLFSVRTSVINHDGQERAGLVLARVEQAPDLQAAVEVHVPPGETRTVDLHLRLPPTLAPGSHFDLVFSLNSLEHGRALLSPSGQPLIDSLRMQVEKEPLVTAVMLEPEPPRAPEWYWPYDEHLMSYECTIAARIDTGHERQTLSITEENLPTQLVDWDGIDAFVIARQGPLRDPVAMAAMGRWLAAGGQAWVMLDAVGQDDLNVLLPDGMTCETIDDVELTDFVVDADLVLPISEADRTVTSEQPLRLRRVVQSGGTVTHRINGFPAAIWFPIGKGSLLVTTLEGRGWVKPRVDRQRTEPLLDSGFQLHTWAKPMAEQFYEQPNMRSPLDAAEIN
jgi:hypothetical protein